MLARNRPIVEDDFEILLRELRKSGYMVPAERVTSTAAEAIARWRARDHDAATIDLLLPDMSGPELLAKLRGELTNHRTPIIVVTVVPDAEIVASRTRQPEKA